MPIDRDVPRGASPTTAGRRGFSAVPFLGDLVVLTRLLRDPSASGGLKLVALAALLYVALPFDAFPEALLPWIAWIDDVGVVLALRWLLEPKLARYRYPLFDASPEDRIAESRIAESRIADSRIEGSVVEKPGIAVPSPVRVRSEHIER
jgi:uncharacterized membrane protein YkvA (DUF1232 family)